MSHDQQSLVPLIIKSVGLCASTALMCFSMYKIMQKLDPRYESEKNAKKQMAAIMKALKLDPNKIQLNAHEMRIGTLINVSDDNVTLAQVGGCASVLDRLDTDIIQPLRLVANKITIPSSLYSPPRGVLLHGPPGCGKTLIARAIAREVDAFFINFDISLLTDMYYGETAKLTKALFTLARKIQPCVIFIDEIDSVLRDRCSRDHETTAIMKTQFMALWDGFLNSDTAVIIIGATNRPRDVDDAILRRLPLKIHVPLPNEKAREQILRLILRDENLADGFDFTQIAAQTDKLSGSDLKEVVRCAILARYRIVARELMNMPEVQRDQHLETVKLSQADIMLAIAKFTGRSTTNLTLD